MSQMEQLTNNNNNNNNNNIVIPMMGGGGSSSSSSAAAGGGGAPPYGGNSKMDTLARVMALTLVPLKVKYKGRGLPLMVEGMNFLPRLHFP
ncbi:hypothetical protein L0F63_001397 [Massospora cicadina]|nr:hypothetical protein L0F63_001397 [Massospora cicadina]